MLFLSISTSFAKKLQARFAYSSFFAPGNGPYIETYLNVSGQSVNYHEVKPGFFSATIEISLVFRQGDSVKYFDKYNLLSPETTDTLKTIFDFTDQKRVSLPNGTYSLEMTIKDKNDPTNKPYTMKQEVLLSFYPNVVAISDIEPLKSFTASTKQGPLLKNGFELVPLVDNFFSNEDKSLKFYAEIYNTSSVLDKEPFLLSYYIETFEQKEVLENFGSVSKQNPQPVNIVMADIDITNLPSGNYNLVIDVKNHSNEVLASGKIFFQRSKILQISDVGDSDFRGINVANTFVAKMNNKDTLAENIRCLWPISSPMENIFAENQMEIADLKTMQQFFYDFWQRRNKTNPSAEWFDYKAKVDRVNDNFSSGKKKGYLTERGRVYLQYGAPNQITKNYNEPTSYPYEIWQYYKVKNQSNRKFVFYNVNLGTNDFALLHSDAKGEIYEQQWELILKKRTESLHDFDQTTPSGTGYGTHSGSDYANPH